MTSSALRRRTLSVIAVAAVLSSAGCGATGSPGATADPAYAP